MSSTLELLGKQIGDNGNSRPERNLIFAVTPISMKVQFLMPNRTAA